MADIQMKVFLDAEASNTEIKRPEETMSSNPIPAIRAALPGFFSHTGRALQRDQRDEGSDEVQLEIANAGLWLVDHHSDNLVKRLRKTDACQKDIFPVSFADMQWINLQKLQIKLVKHAVTRSRAGEESPDWEKDLAMYSRLCPECFAVP